MKTRDVDVMEEAIYEAARLLDDPMINEGATTRFWTLLVSLGVDRDDLPVRREVSKKVEAGKARQKEICRFCGEMDGHAPDCRMSKAVDQEQMDRV